jgi:hypothetical protein
MKGWEEVAAPGGLDVRLDLGHFAHALVQGQALAGEVVLPHADSGCFKGQARPQVRLATRILGA